MRIERLIYSVLVLAAATLAIINWRRAALFKADNESLRSQVEMLQAEAENSGRLIEVTRDSSQKIRAQAKELMQLRNELAQLRNDRERAGQVVTAAVNLTNAPSGVEEHAAAP